MKKKVLLTVFVFVFSLFATIGSVFAESEIKYDNYNSATISCGEKLMTGIPNSIPKVVSIFYTFIQVIIPILLVIFGSIDLVKGITSQKEDEMKKGQQMFIKRIITAAIVFFVFVIVKFVISLVADGTSSRILDCTECFIKNNDKCVEVTYEQK